MIFTSKCALAFLTIFKFMADFDSFVLFLFSHCQLHAGEKNNFNPCIMYFRIFAPKCAACGEGITPVEGTSDTVRVVAMEKDFHVDCYVCEVRHGLGRMLTNIIS